jgi:YjjG family noncanonical pyrimidine nucleotidase
MTAKSYDLFLFDLDDTLLDFKASEKLSFKNMIESFGVKDAHPALFGDYQTINTALWKAFEEGKTSKEELKVERFRRLFEKHQLEIDPAVAGIRYLENLPETVVLVDHAHEILQWLSEKGEIGIVSNGIHATQLKRIAKTQLGPYFSFVAVSEQCGFAKPDARFFEFAVKLARKFAKPSTLMIGDRLETDILGARNFGIDGVWFNPEKLSRGEHKPHHEIHHLSELRRLFA